MVPFQTAFFLLLFKAVEVQAATSSPPVNKNSEPLAPLPTTSMLSCPKAAMMEPAVQLHSQFGPEAIDKFHQLKNIALKRKYKPNASQNNARFKLYLHADRLIQTETPELLDHMLQAMQQADSAQWGHWSPSFNMRVVEFHEYRAGAGLTSKLHFDEGSAYTMIIMLSRPGSDFTGGIFRTWEADDNWKAHHLQQGDCLVIPSHKLHTVDKVTSGVRNVVVMEVWQGPEGVSDVREIPATGTQGPSEPGCSYRPMYEFEGFEAQIRFRYECL